jgi:hypothetical protein
MKGSKHSKGLFRINDQKDNGVFLTDEIGSGAVVRIYGINTIIKSKEEAEANADLVMDAFNTATKTGFLPSELLEQKNELLELFKKVIDSCNPQDVTPHKISNGVDLGEYYVGSCGIPSNELVHLAINTIDKYK